MTAQDTVDLRIEALLDELAPPRVPDYVADVQRATRSVGQRPAWSFPQRWLPIEIRAPRIALGPILALVALLVALTLLAIAVGSRRTVPLPIGPARNGIVVYDNAGRIVAVDPVTRTTTPLSGGVGDDSRPAISPDGRRIAFLRIDAGRQDVVVMDVGGAQPHAALTIDGATESFKLEPPVWAPNSDRIAVTVLVGAESAVHAEVRVIDVDVGTSSTLALAGLVGVEAPTWAPDGHRLAVLGEPADRSGAFLYVVDVDTSRLTRLSDRPGSAGTGYWFPPRWSPDGRSLVASYGDDARGRDVIVLAADGAGETPLATTASDEAQPAWSPDGAAIAFWRSTGHDTWRPVIASMADRTERALDLESMAADSLAWSPDGTELTVLWCVPATRCDIALIDASGGDHRELIARVDAKSYDISNDQAYWSFQRLAP